MSSCRKVPAKIETKPSLMDLGSGFAVPEGHGVFLNLLKGHLPTQYLEYANSPHYRLKIQPFRAGGYEVTCKKVESVFTGERVNESKMTDEELLERYWNMSDEQYAALQRRRSRRRLVDEVVDYLPEERSVRRSKTQSRYKIKSIGADRLLTLTMRESLTLEVGECGSVRRSALPVLGGVSRDGRGDVGSLGDFSSCDGGFEAVHSHGQRGSLLSAPEVAGACGRVLYKTKADWKEAWAEFVRRMKRAGYPIGGYVAVLEKHKKGNYHMHVAIRGYVHLKTANRVWWAVVGGRGQGAVNVRYRPDLSAPKRLAGIAKYLSKYLSKQFGDSDFNKKRYFASKHSLLEPMKYACNSSVGAITDVLKEFACAWGLDYEKLLKRENSWIFDNGSGFWFNYTEDLLAPVPF